MLICLKYLKWEVERFIIAIRQIVYYMFPKALTKIIGCLILVASTIFWNLTQQV